MLFHSDPDTTWYFNEWCGGHSSGPWGPPSICPLLLPGQMLYLVVIPILQLHLISPLSCYSYFVYIVALYSPTAEEISPQLDKHLSTYQQQREEKAVDLSEFSQLSPCGPVSSPQLV